MKLKAQPPVSRRAARSTRAKTSRAGPRPKGRQATRPGVPLRHRLSGRLPSIRRILAGLAAVALGAGLVALLNGPWLTVRDVAWEGERWTDPQEIERVLDDARGMSALAVDTRDLSARIERLPSVAAATVSASLTGGVEAAIVEPEPSFVWVTTTRRFVGAADGTIFAAMRDDDPIPADLADVPAISDERFAARIITVGDVIGAETLDIAMRLTALDPAELGSEETAVQVRVDDDYGFRLVAPDAGWTVALGVYGLDPNEADADRTARLERQVTAVRTLFASHPETGIRWVDVRNPGKVYFRAKG
jgi:hypothetical protein